MRIPRNATAILASLALVAGGCTNPFLPAKPEPPVSGGIVERYTTPDETLNTIAEAFRVRGVAGQRAINNALGDNATNTADSAFYAKPSLAAQAAWLAEHPGVTPTDPWTRKEERTCFDYMAGSFSGYTYILSWTVDRSRSDPDTTNLPPNVKYIRRHYELEVRDGNDDVVTIAAIGNADLWFQLVGTKYLLYRWDDYYDLTVGLSPSNSDEVSMTVRRLESVGN